jgi:serine/threonine protein kinase/tetratricopeptide (TPR) repeat protein
MTEESLFLAALEKPAPAERQAFLVQACGEDVELRHRVERLLQAHERTSGVLEHGPRDLAATDSLQDVAPLPPGTVVAGRYKMLELLGEGGMGSVWLAEQTQPVRRKVALKIIKAGMDSRQVIARFEAERQALALMDHPNIAKVFDAGTTRQGDKETGRQGEKHQPDSLSPCLPVSLSDSGRPFFVMEYVQGKPLTKYCDEGRLTLQERLLLFIQICQAVQHAHQKGIVHRDLKPSNILVVPPSLPVEGKGGGIPMPKIIDFGLAKALHQPLTERTLHTALGMILGTPMYMSPEQAEFNNLDIDTRADIYSLGVILYELLAGTPPFTKEELHAAALTEMLRMIKEDEPAKPSTRLSSATDVATVAANRRLEPKHLKKFVSGDLDWIVMKCLEKERGRRYATANALAADLLRHLSDEPVEARPPSAGYRVRKFIRRNRGAVLAAAGMVALLVLGIVASTWQAVRATAAEAHAVLEGREKDKARVRAEEAEGLAKARLVEVTKEKQRADEEARIAQAVNDFLQHDLLRQADSRAQADRGFRPDPGLTVRTALDRAAARIGDRFREQPLVEAAIRHAMGEAYVGLGEPLLAIPHLKRARELSESQLGSTHSKTLRSRTNLAGAYWMARKLDQAIELSEQTLAIVRQLHGPDHVDTQPYTQNLAVAYLAVGRTDEALPLLRQVLAVYEKHFGGQHPKTLTALNNLAATLRDSGKPAEALPYYVRSLKGLRQLHGPDHPSTLHANQVVGASHFALGQVDRAIPYFQEALRGRKAILAANHPDTLDTLASLGVAYRDSGRTEQGLPMIEEAYQHGGRHPSLVWIGNALLQTYARAGMLDKAADLTQKRVTAARQQNPPGSPQLTGVLSNIGSALLRGGAFALAEPILRESLEIGDKIQPEQWTTHNNRSTLGGVLLGQKRFAEAEPLLVQGYEGLKKALAPGAPRDTDPTIPATRQQRLAEALDRLIELYEAWGKPDEAARWRKAKP